MKKWLSKNCTCYLKLHMGNYWGVILSSPLSLVELGEHLQHHLIVQNEHSERYLMRLYDPRALQPFLKALTNQQAATFFEPIKCIWADDTGKPEHWRCYHFRNNQIQLNSQHIICENTVQGEACPC